MSDILPIKRSKAQARRFYDRISGVYDTLTASEQALIKLGLQRLQIQPGEAVLEIGPGTGSGLEIIAKNHPGVLCGLDLSRRMLQKSQHKTRNAQPQPIHIQGDGVNLPFQKAFFDAVYMSFTMELFSQADITALLDECRRVLTSSGRLGLISLVDSPRTLALKIYEHAHQLFPVAVDCRPIPLAHLLETHGFEVKTILKKRNWGLPIHLTLSVKHQ